MQKHGWSAVSVNEKALHPYCYRLSSCRFCDKIAVFHEGRLIQQGSHEQLVQDKGGKYYEMYNISPS